VRPDVVDPFFPDVPFFVPVAGGAGFAERAEGGGAVFAAPRGVLGCAEEGVAAPASPACAVAPAHAKNVTQRKKIFAPRDIAPTNRTS